jgi:1-acyl-sn-glycerol-3-phosphate acyltransferase
MPIVYSICHATAKGLARAAFDFRVVGREHLIEEGPALICPNHVSYLDPPLVGSAFAGPVYFLARKSLFSNTFAHWLYTSLMVVPVDQERAGFGGLKTLIKLLGERKRVVLFPEGSRSADGQLQKGEPGAGLVVAKARVPVVPMRLFGPFEALPIGSGRLQMNTVTAVIGPALRFDRETDLPEGREGYQLISNRIMAAIAALSCPEDRVPSARR